MGSVTHILGKNLFHNLVTPVVIWKIRWHPIIGLTSMTSIDNLTFPVYGCQVKKNSFGNKIRPKGLFNVLRPVCSTIV